MLCDTRDTEGPHGRGGDCGGLAKKGGSFMEEEISKCPSTRGGLDEWRITGGLQALPVQWRETEPGSETTELGDQGEGCRGRPLWMVMGLEVGGIWHGLEDSLPSSSLLFLSFKIKNILYLMVS